MGCGYSSCHCCILFKSPRSYHSSAWPPSFQIPVASFLSLKVSLATRDHLAQLYDRPEVPGNECSLASNNERWNQYPSTLPSGQMTLEGCVSQQITPNCPHNNLPDNAPFTDYSPFSVSFSNPFIGISWDHLLHNTTVLEPSPESASGETKWG